MVQPPKDPAKNKSRNKKLAPFGIIFALLGLLLFAYTVRKAGVSEIMSGLRRLGAGFLLILLFSAIRQCARSLAWIKCLEAPYRLRFRDALAARIMGDALGNIVPLASMAVSEPSKAAFVRDRVPLMIGLSALAIENIFYSLSVILFIFSGTTALLLSFTLPKPLRIAAIGTLIASVVIAPLAFLIIRQRWKFLSGAFALLGRRVKRGWVEQAITRSQTMEERIYGFYDRNRAHFLSILGLEFCFHLAGVAEVYTTLSFVSDTVAPTLFTAFILESVNRVINVAFKFVPLRTGVDEYGSGTLAKVLGFTKATGVTLAIVRKARDIFWTGVGVILMVRRGLSLRGVERQAEAVADENT
ncbi:MAG TPA: lysylphosphatidylglycerol synthase domain-containing protein [Pyrinomonadaceae bacterium]|nr:lysylphosphatidylglycerol synthase domain-containing protein [Pyrinomonadaceae bacterium]